LLGRAAVMLRGHAPDAWNIRPTLARSSKTTTQHHIQSANNTIQQPVHNINGSSSRHIHYINLGNTQARITFPPLAIAFKVREASPYSH
jgi:hypothetical protein